MRRNAWLAVVYGGLIAGTIDVFAPALIYWINPLGVLRFIAGGVLGRPLAQAMGLQAAALGLLLQWLMSLVISAIFVYAATRIPALLWRWIASGIAYGVVVWYVMNYVVRPLSMHRDFPRMDVYGFVTNMAAMWVFGLIIAWFAQRHLRALSP